MRGRIVLLLACLNLAALPFGVSASRGAASTACVAPQQVTALADGPHGTLLIGARDGSLYRRSAERRCTTLLATLPGRIAVGTLLAVADHPSWLIAGGSLLITTQLSASLYRSADGGKTWARGTRGLSATPILPVALFFARRAARSAGQLWSVFGVETLPSVMESPKVTIAAASAGAATSTAAR